MEFAVSSELSDYKIFECCSGNEKLWINEEENVVKG